MTMHSSAAAMAPFVRSAALEVDQLFPRPDWTSTYPNHGEGSATGAYAVDFMVSSKALGDRIAQYLWDNRVRLNVRYVIWYRRIISRTNLPSRWRPYVNPVKSKRGTASGDHTNHPHASFFPGAWTYRPPAGQATPATPALPAGAPSTRVVYVDKLAPGQRNSDSVRWVQIALGVKVTGTYDAATVEAVKRRQAAWGDDVIDGDLGALGAAALLREHAGLGLRLEARS